MSCRSSTGKAVTSNIPQVCYSTYHFLNPTCKPAMVQLHQHPGSHVSLSKHGPACPPTFHADILISSKFVLSQYPACMRLWPSKVCPRGRCWLTVSCAVLSGKDVSLAARELDPEIMEMGLIAGLGARSRRRYYRRMEARSDARSDASTEPQPDADMPDALSEDPPEQHEQPTGSERSDGSDSDDERDSCRKDSIQPTMPNGKHASHAPRTDPNHDSQQAIASSSKRQAASAQQPALIAVEHKSALETGDHSPGAGCQSGSSHRYAPASDSLPSEVMSDAAELSGAAESASDASAGGPRAPSQGEGSSMVATREHSPAAAGSRSGAKLLDRPGRAAASRRARWTAANGHAALQDENKLSTDSASHMLHGKLVVAACQERAGIDGISQLATRFRKAFVQALRPAFLPPAWEIDHS